MNQSVKRAGVLGAGSWGAALAIVLHDNGWDVSLWSNDAAEIERIRSTRRLLHRLPDVMLPPAIHAESDVDAFVKDAELLVVAVPSNVISSFAESFRPALSGSPKLVVSATKGIEALTLKTPSEQLEESWSDAIDSGAVRGVAALSGPSHAEETALGMPTAVVAAHHDDALAAEAQAAFQTERFRVYRNGDRRGVEIGAALKNVLAIAVGVSDGLGYGDNARAALISRGLHELSLIGAALGARQETFMGLSGLGDLVVTCTSRHSRNRRFGELIAKGYSTRDAVDEIGMAVEGVTAVKAVPKLIEACGGELPISQEVHSIVMEGRDPRQAVENLMKRETKAERPVSR